MSELHDLCERIAEAIDALPVQPPPFPFLHWPRSDIERLAELADAAGHPRPVEIDTDPAEEQGILYTRAVLTFTGPEGDAEFANYSYVRYGRVERMTMTAETKRALVAVLRRWAKLEQQALPAAEDRTTEPQIQKCWLLAHQSHERAIEKGATGTLENIHRWLRENDPDDYELPPLANWMRYLRAYKSAINGRQNEPRRGRGGRSIVKRSELD